MQRILGIDPGSRITGWGVIDSDGVRSRHVASGSLRLKADEMPQRLGEIFHGVSNIVAEHRPAMMAVEQVFVSRNAATALKLGQARGAAICAGVAGGLVVAEYSPREVKLSVVGTGAAEKAQVQHMVQRILGLVTEPATDEADALAIAITHAHSLRMQQNLLRLAGRQR